MKSKMRTALSLWLLAGLLSALPAGAFAARADVGTSGAAFLKLNAGSRPAAMGETFTGIADDVNALFYNPAGAATAAAPQFTAQYGSWFQSISYNALGFVYPVRNAGTFGVGVVNLSAADIEKRTADTENPDSTFNAADYAYFLHYSHRLGEKVSAGVNAKIISQKIDDRSATSFAGDAGVLWQTPVERLTAGLCVQNIGSGVKFVNESDPLPLNVRLGFGYGLLLSKRSTLTIGTDACMPRDNDMLYSAGMELKQMLSKDISAALRGGYKTVSQEKLGGLSGVTAGGGVTWRQFSLDFAWVPYGDLGDTFRYSLVVKF
jgi:hypothetical protein